MDDIQDYEYYAKDVKLEDITSDEYNADILSRLRDNDPEWTFFAIDTEGGDFVVREGDHLGWLGYFIGRSQKLETLYIGEIVHFPDNVYRNDFLRGVGRNRSIEKLEFGIDLGENFQSLIHFLKNNDSLHELAFYAFDIGLQCARNIALLLGQQSSLKCLTFSEEIDLDDEVLSHIATALRSQPQIEELSLSSNSLGRKGFVALGNALEGCLSLRKLDFAAFNNHVDNNIDDEGIHVITEGLKHCHNLTSLLLCGDLMITEAGSRSLSALFQSGKCRLEHLDLAQMNIDDDKMAVLATGLASLPSLTRLELRDNSIGDQGLQALVGGLVNCNLQELNLSRNMLDSVSGMRALGTLVRRTTGIRMLNLIHSSITDEGLQSFVEGLANSCSLTDLYISNRSITANGLASLSSLLRAEQCSLRTLSLYGINIGDDGAAALANGLIGNKSLTNLYFDNSRITARGWGAFRGLLCDTSSVNNTYLSNHTLEMIGECYIMRGTPSDIVQYLKWNESHNQATAICKILHSHPDIDVTPLFQFNLDCLPLVVEWFEKVKSQVNMSTKVFKFKSRQLSVVYKFIRGMPLLAANGYRSQRVKDVHLQVELNSRKRKLDQTV